MVTNALSFDLEEWYHPEAIRQSGLQVTRTARVEPVTENILSLLSRYNVKATFFTVGEVAAEHPHLVEKIFADGHELAFHGWTHDPLWAMTPETFTREVEQFLQWRDQNFSGVDILGFRAPTFSLDPKTAWSIQILREHGFTYDSSIFPASTPLYGVPDASLAPYTIHESNVSQPSDTAFLEIPMSVFSVGSLRVGFTGGLYLRALPYRVVKQFFQRTNTQGRSAVVYIHPWETDASTPRVALSRWGKFVLYTGLPMTNKLEKLLQDFSFDTMQAVFLNQD